MKIIIYSYVTEYNFLINSRKYECMTVYYWQIFHNRTSKADKPLTYIALLFFKVCLYVALSCDNFLIWKEDYWHSPEHEITGLHATQNYIFHMFLLSAKP